jgi:NYN domain
MILVNKTTGLPMDLYSSVPTATRNPVAILVDGDNFPRAQIAGIETEAQLRGEVTIRRVFGDMSLHKDWAQDIAYTATHSPTSAGKNRADIMLVIAAMDLAHRGLAKGFVIVSDDRDFAPLVNHLREHGYRVEWLGKSQNVQEEKKAAKSIAQTETKEPRHDPILGEVRAIVGGAGAAGFPIQSLGPSGQKAGIKISETPQKSWRAWLLAHSETFVCDPRGPDARVRLKAQTPIP